MSPEQEDRLCEALVNLGWLTTEQGLHAEGVRTIQDIFIAHSMRHALHCATFASVSASRKRRRPTTGHRDLRAVTMGATISACLSDPQTVIHLRSRKLTRAVRCQKCFGTPGFRRSVLNQRPTPSVAMDLALGSCLHCLPMLWREELEKNGSKPVPSATVQVEWGNKL